MAPALLAAAIVIGLSACGGSAGAAPSTPEPGATPTPTPLGLGGNPGDGETATRAPGATDDAGAESPAAGNGGRRTLGDVQLLAGDMLWDATIDYSGFGDWDRWKVNVDIVIRRDGASGPLVFAKGSIAVVDWSRNPVDDGCPDSAQWTADIATPDGENWHPLSDQSPEATGIAWEGEHDLRLDISLFPRPDSDICTFPGTNLSCPIDPMSALGTPPRWEVISDEPAELHYSCTDTSVANSSAVYTVNTRGIIEEARDVPPSE